MVSTEEWNRAYDEVIGDLVQEQGRAIAKARYYLSAGDPDKARQALDAVAAETRQVYRQRVHRLVQTIS